MRRPTTSSTARLATTCDHLSGDTFPVGSTTVTCSATDDHGNTSTASFTVTVTDTTTPVVSPPADVTVEATSAAGAVATFADATADDIVDGSLEVTCDHASGESFPMGVTTITCSATDAHGNTGTASFTVTVSDTTAPVVTPPADVTVEATGGSGAPVTFGTATALDTVDGPVAVTCDHTSGEMFPVGSTTVTCRATDEAANTGSASFSVTATAPVQVKGASASASGSGSLPRTGRNIAAAVLAGISLILIGFVLRRRRRRQVG